MITTTSLPAGEDAQSRETLVVRPEHAAAKTGLAIRQEGIEALHRGAGRLCVDLTQAGSLSSHALGQLVSLRNAARRKQQASIALRVLPHHAELLERAEFTRATGFVVTVVEAPV